MNWIKGNLKTLVVAVVATLVGGALPAMAVAYDSNNSRAVDGLSAVKSNAKASARKGKLVATSPTTGKLPAGIIPKAPDSAKLGGKLPAAYTLDSEFLSLLPPDLADGDQTGGTAVDVQCSVQCVSEGELDFDPATQSELSAVNAALGAEVNSVEAQVNNVEAQVANLGSSVANLSNEVNALESDINSLSSTVASLTATVNNLSSQFNSLGVPGTINNTGNPVHWTKLKGVPADFADGTDATASIPNATNAGSPQPVTTTVAFISATTTVNLLGNQKIFISVDQALGAGGTAAANLNIYPCYQLSGGSLQTVGGGIFGLTAPANSRLTYSVSGITAPLAAGTYVVGMCGSSSTPANWNNNEWGYVNAMVLS